MTLFLTFMRIVVRGAPEAPDLRSSANKKNIGHCLKCSVDVLKCTDSCLKCTVGGHYIILLFFFSDMPHTKIEKCPVCRDRHTVSECNSTDCQRSGGCKQSYVVDVMCSSCKREAEKMKLWNGKKDFADYDLHKQFY